MADRTNSTRTRDCKGIIEDNERGPLIFSRKEITRRPLKFLKLLSPLLFSHHPSCAKYEIHTFTFRKRRWCIGCYFNTLFFSLSLLFLFAIWALSPLSIDRNLLYYGGLGGLGAYLLIGILPIRETKSRKILSKFILGASFASVFFIIVTAGGSIDFMIQEKAVYIMLLFIVLITALMAKRGLEMSKTCESCEYRMRWSRCPGFTDLVCVLVENGFIIPRPKKE